MCIDARRCKYLPLPALIARQDEILSATRTMQPTRLDLPGIRSDLREQKTSSSIFVWTTLSGKKRKQALFTEIDDEQNL